MVLDRGNFNPGTKQGQANFNEKSKGLPQDTRLQFLRINGPKTCTVLCIRELLLYGIMGVPTLVALNGKIRKSSNLLSQHQKITLKDCQNADNVML
jgi:hypothetical protein